MLHWRIPRRTRSRTSSYVHVSDRPRGRLDGIFVLTLGLKAFKKLLSSAEHHLWASEEQQNKSATEAHRGVWGTCSVQSAHVYCDYLLKAAHQNFFIFYLFIYISSHLYFTLMQNAIATTPNFSAGD